MVVKCAQHEATSYVRVCARANLCFRCDKPTTSRQSSEIAKTETCGCDRAPLNTMAPLLAINLCAGLVLIGCLATCVCQLAATERQQPVLVPLESLPVGRQPTSSAAANRLERRTPTETSLGHLSATATDAHRPRVASPVSSAQMLTSDASALNSINYVPSPQLSSIGHYTRIMPANNPIEVQQPSNSFLVRNGNNIHLVEQPLTYQNRRQQNQIGHYEPQQPHDTGRDSAPGFEVQHTFASAPSATSERTLTNAYLDSIALMNVPVLDANVSENQTSDTSTSADLDASRGSQAHTAPTIEQSNNIIAQTAPESIIEPSIHTVSHSDDPSSNNQVLQAPQANASGNTNSSLANDLTNNQVIYEAPQVSSGMDNYYFSSAEKLPKVDSRSSNLWW